MRLFSGGFGTGHKNLPLVMVVVVTLLAGACTNSSEGATTSTTSPVVPPTTAAVAETVPDVAGPELVAGDPAELSAALVAGKETRPGPYVYAELATVCDDGCNVAQVEVYFKPDPNDTTRRTAVEAWNGNVSFDPSDQVWTGDPLLIAEELLAAVDEGKVVQWEIDVLTGLVVAWSVDGAGAAYHCLSVDTAPLENRDRTCGGRVYRR